MQLKIVFRKGFLDTLLKYILLYFWKITWKAQTLHAITSYGHYIFPNAYNKIMCLLRIYSTKHTYLFTDLVKYGKLYFQPPGRPGQQTKHSYQSYPCRGNKHEKAG